MSVRKLVLYSEYPRTRKHRTLHIVCMMLFMVVHASEDHHEPSHEDNDAHIYHRKQTRNIREEPSLAKSDVGTNAAP